MCWGLILLATVVLILAEIALRQTPFGSLRGSDEISGYVMAGLASWGLTYAMLERAHVRIDMVQHKLRASWRCALDVLAIASVAAVSSTVAIYSWNVLAKTIKRGSHANTPLETPLWIPQSIWFSGWVWFAITSTLLTMVALILFAKSRREELSAIVGNPGSQELDTLHIEPAEIIQVSMDVNKEDKP